MVSSTEVLFERSAQISKTRVVAASAANVQLEETTRLSGSYQDKSRALNALLSSPPPKFWVHSDFPEAVTVLLYDTVMQPVTFHGTHQFDLTSGSYLPYDSIESIIEKWGQVNAWNTNPTSQAGVDITDSKALPIQKLAREYTLECDEGVTKQVDISGANPWIKVKFDAYQSADINQDDWTVKREWGMLSYWWNSSPARSSTGASRYLHTLMDLPTQIDSTYSESAALVSFDESLTPEETKLMALRGPDAIARFAKLIKKSAASKVALKRVTPKRGKGGVSKVRSKISLYKK